MQHTCLALFGVVGLAVLFSCNKPADTTHTSAFEADTTLANMYMARAEALKGAQPDSAIRYHLLAIELLAAHNKPEANHQRALCHVKAASIHCINGNFSEKHRHDSLALHIASQTSDDDIRSQVINSIGVEYFLKGEYDSAMASYNQAMTLAKAADNKIVQTKIVTNIGIISFMRGDVEQAMKNFLSTLDIARQANDSDLLAGSLLNVGQLYENMGDHPNALHYYLESLEVYRQIAGKDGMLLCYQNMGNIYLTQGNYAKTLEVYDLSLRLATEIDDDSNIAKAHHNIGEVYTFLGDYEKAAREYHLAISMKEKLEDNDGLAISLASLGALHFRNNNTEKALDNYRKALEINQRLDNKKNLALNYANLADVYTHAGKTDSAIAFHLKSLDYYKTMNNREGISTQYVNLGIVFRKTNERTKAEEYLKKAIAEKQAIPDYPGLSAAYTELANLLTEQASGIKTTRLAIANGMKAWNIADSIGSMPLKREAASALHQAWKLAGNPAQALRFAEEYIEAHDSMFNTSRIEALQLAEARWNDEKRQQQIEELEDQRRLQAEIIRRKESEGRQSRIIAWAVTAVLLLGGIAAAALFHSLKRRKDLQFQKQLTHIASHKMKNIRNRLSPHFLFNVLNHISASAHNAEEVKQKVNSLSLLLRKTLQNIEQNAIPLHEELSLVQAFVDLQRERIPQPFHFDLMIPETIDRQRHVPAMILQIPVENAIKHGLMPLTEGERLLRVTVNEENSMQKILIQDNGIGFSASADRTTGTGTGLRALMQTIHLLNANNREKIQFSIREAQVLTPNASGTSVEILIPFDFSFDLV